MHIAIVDDIPADSEYLRSSVCRFAKEHSIPLTPPPALYESREAFLERFENGSYDIIFLDIFMKQINGMDTARRIRECDRDCRLVFATTSAVDITVSAAQISIDYHMPGASRSLAEKPMQKTETA